MRALDINRATELISVSFISPSLSVVVSVSLCLHYINIFYSVVWFSIDGRHTARTRPSERYFVNGRCSGQRTPHVWSPIRELTGRRPGPIAATRLLDLEDEGFERPAEYSGRGGATYCRCLCPLLLSFIYSTHFSACHWDFAVAPHLSYLSNQFSLSLLRCWWLLVFYRS